MKQSKKLRNPREPLTSDQCDRWVRWYEPVKAIEGRPGLVNLSGFFMDMMGWPHYLMNEPAIDMRNGTFQIEAAVGLRIVVHPAVVG